MNWNQDRGFKLAAAAASLIAVLGVFFASAASSAGSHFPGLHRPASGAISTVTIKKGSTVHMSCTGMPVLVCMPTASGAILGVTDLQHYLANGNVTVNNGGSGSDAKADIIVKSPLTWSSANTLELDAYRSLIVDNPIKITGTGGLTLSYNVSNTGEFVFGAKGYVNFWNTSSSLTINRAPYVLVSSVNSNSGSVAALASAVAADNSQNYAFGTSYDASGDGTYGASPVSTIMTGSLEGLGNTISNLTINANDTSAALFGQVGGGTVRDLGLVNINVSATKGWAAAFAASATGAMINVYSTGTIMGSGAAGLVGSCCNNEDRFVIENSWSSASIAASNIDTAYAGGLFGCCEAQITNSHATGSVTAAAGNCYIGGIAGGAFAVINSYESGSVTATCSFGEVGGLAGYLSDVGIQTSFATGSVYASFNADGDGGYVGGLAGDIGDSAIENSYSTSSVVLYTGVDDGSALGGLYGLRVVPGVRPDRFLYPYCDLGNYSGRPLRARSSRSVSASERSY